MVNELVKLSNSFNSVALNNFDAVELDVLMAISSRVRERGTQHVTFSFSELRQLMNLQKNMTTAQFVRKLLSTNRKLLETNSMLVTDDGRIIQFALFTTFETSTKDQTLEVSVNERFAFLLNDLTSRFTRFELAEFTGLTSKYAKEFYRRAKQFRSTGVWRIGREDFCRLLDVPKSMRSVNNLNKFVLKPIVDEVGPLIHLEVERVYERKPGQRGRAGLSGFVFRFDKERDAPVRVDAGDGAREDPREGRWYELAEGRVFWCPAEYDGNLGPGLALAHLQGDLELGRCPVCLYDAQNRPFHGSVAPEAPEYADTVEKPVRGPYEPHFQPNVEKARQDARRTEAEQVAEQAEESLRTARKAAPLFIDPMRAE